MHKAVVKSCSRRSGLRRELPGYATDRVALSKRVFGLGLGLWEGVDDRTSEWFAWVWVLVSRDPATPQTTAGRPARCSRFDVDNGQMQAPGGQLIRQTLVGIWEQCRTAAAPRRSRLSWSGSGLVFGAAWNGSVKTTTEDFSPRPK